MFILYAIVLGLAIGLLAGGRLEGLARIQIHWSAAIVAGLLIQVLLFSAAVSERVGSLGPPIYVASTALVFAAVVRNHAIPGMRIVIAGATCNLAAIVANGGFMPAAPGALAALGKADPTIYSNSSVVEVPALQLFTDVFALPRWLPWANIFSLGDVLIGIGVVAVMVLAMRTGRRPEMVPA